MERLIGTIRREFLDHTLFWNAVDLERKLADCKVYYNDHLTRSSQGDHTQAEISGDSVEHPAPLNSYTWEKHCGGLFQLPVAALVLVRRETPVGGAREYIAILTADSYDLMPSDGRRTETARSIEPHYSPICRSGTENDLQLRIHVPIRWLWTPRPFLSSISCANLP